MRRSEHKINITAAWLPAPRLRLPAFAQDHAARSDRTRSRRRPAGGPEFNYQTGNIVLPNKVATLHLGERYRYLDPRKPTSC